MLENKGKEVWYRVKKNLLKPNRAKYIFIRSFLFRTIYSVALSSQTVILLKPVRMNGH